MSVGTRTENSEAPNQAATSQDSLKKAKERFRNFMRMKETVILGNALRRAGDDIEIPQEMHVGLEGKRFQFPEKMNQWADAVKVLNRLKQHGYKSVSIEGSPEFKRRVAILAGAKGFESNVSLETTDLRLLVAMGKLAKNPKVMKGQTIKKGAVLEQ